MRAEISQGRSSNRHPLDWCVDQPWVADQLALALDAFWYERAHGLAVWDPSCGLGNTLQAAFYRGVPVIGSDLVNNFAWSEFRQPVVGSMPCSADFILRDFFEFRAAPRKCSIICNPPYSYEEAMAERFVRHALTLTSKLVCVLVPLKWKAAQRRYDLFTEFPPLATLNLCQRPSMPPGDRIEALGKDAFKNGKGDFCWIVWDVTVPTAVGETREFWLPPLPRNSEIRPIWERADA